MSSRLGMGLGYTLRGWSAAVREVVVGVAVWRGADMALDVGAIATGVWTYGDVLGEGDFRRSVFCDGVRVRDLRDGDHGSESSGGEITHVVRLLFVLGSLFHNMNFI